MDGFSELTSHGQSSVYARRRELLDALDAAQAVVSREWSFRANQKIRALGIEGAGRDSDRRVLAGSEDGFAYMLDATGKLLWNFEVGGWVLGAGFAALADDSDAFAVVGGAQLALLDAAGQPVVSIPCESPVTSLCIGSFAGSTGVISGHENGIIQAFSVDRGVYWQATCPKRVVSLQCCDVDFDGHPEIIAACEDTSVYILDEDGAIRDRFRSTHWIISLAVGDVFGDGTPRVVVAGFDGDVHVYGGGKAAALRVRRRGILGIDIGRLLTNSTSEQFVVGSSDQRIAIFDPAGRELWRFRMSFGHRVVKILPSESTPSLVVGAEDGMVHCVRVDIQPDLRQRIIEIAETIPTDALGESAMSPEQVAILADAIDTQKVRLRRSTAKAQEHLTVGSRAAAAQELAGVWHSGAEELWSFSTNGRVYDVAPGPAGLLDHELLLVGSGDGHAYALNIEDGSVAWAFPTGGPVRGVTWITDSHSSGDGVLVGSEDGCIYRLTPFGEPLWHIGTGDWVLNVVGSHDPTATHHPAAWFSSEGGYVEALDTDGGPLWRVNAGDRVRALARGDVDGDGVEELIAGSDDRRVYIINPSSGEVKHFFTAPHWVLVTQACDVNGDGKAEILVGTEDGTVYVYDAEGHLQWSFASNHWIAAVDAALDVSPTANQVVIGSADCSVYGLSPDGDLRWRWDTDARVRTIACCGRDSETALRVAFGSYDESVTMLRVPEPDELLRLAVDTVGDRARTEPPQAIVRRLIDLASLDGERAPTRAISTEVRALAAALDMSRATVSGDPNCEDLAAFLVGTASDHDCLAILRTLTAIGAEEGTAERVAEAILRSDPGPQGKERVTLLRQALGDK